MFNILFNKIVQICVENVKKTTVRKQEIAFSNKSENRSVNIKLIYEQNHKLFDKHKTCFRTIKIRLLFVNKKAPYGAFSLSSNYKNNDKFYNN